MIEDDGGFVGKFTCVQPNAINEIYQIATSLCFAVWFKERKKINILVISSVHFFDKFTQ